jgi:hypothetical protein
VPRLSGITKKATTLTNHTPYRTEIPKKARSLEQSSKLLLPFLFLSYKTIRTHKHTHPTLKTNLLSSRNSYSPILLSLPRTVHLLPLPSHFPPHQKWPVPQTRLLRLRSPVPSTTPQQTARQATYCVICISRPTPTTSDISRLSSCNIFALRGSLVALTSPPTDNLPRPPAPHPTNHMFR